MIYPSTQSKQKLPVIKYARGKHVYDIYGKEYLDFTGSNNTVILGYKKFKLTASPNFPGVSYLESKVSEKLSSFTNTKYFRYFKNGSDAVSCAIRLSRYLCQEEDDRRITNFNKVVGFIGYGGTNNEYAYTINRNGILAPCAYQISNNLERCDDPPYIIVFESRYKHIADKINAKYKICDHLKSGVVGLYEESKIDADFHLYGKSIANGYPVSVMTGKDDLMKEINNIYYSTTFGGDNVGLESILLTLNQFNYPLWKTKHDYAKRTLPEWGSAKDEVIEYFKFNGVLFNGYWQIMTCHTEPDIENISILLNDT